MISDLDLRLRFVRLKPQYFMVKADFIVLRIQPDLNLIPNPIETRFLRVHLFLHSCRNLGLNRKLERMAQSHPQKFLEIAASLLNRSKYIASILH